MTAFKITTLHAFIATEEDGTEGVCAVHTGDGWLPLIAADENRLAAIRPAAQFLATELGKEVTLIRVTAREDLEIIKPEKQYGDQ